MIKLLIASKNFHKIRELRDLFKSLNHIEVISLHQFPDYYPPEETGQTFKENAILKASHAAKALNRWTLADDSGLIVPILRGAPGIYSSRYAGQQATDKENCDKLLHELSVHSSLDSRVAYYECCLAIANPTEVKKVVEGSCGGIIAEAARGRNGFGYDPLFIKNDYDKTFGELDNAVKVRISHRRRAFERLVSFLENLRE